MYYDMFFRYKYIFFDFMYLKNIYVTGTLSRTFILTLSSSLLLCCPQIRLIEGELMQVTKLEIKRRDLDSENLQVGGPAPFLCLHAFILRVFVFSFFMSIRAQTSDHVRLSD